ncbi:MAG TPA: hypothetical protein VG125_20390 [Pirellulales bacterium]|jgi:hypothetical protein|nr:hypothetical protein [Pirellulales bacterium]
MRLRRPFQFSIAALLAIVALSALAANWYAGHRRAVLANMAAEHDYLGAKSSYEVGTALPDTVYSTSVAWLKATLAVPLGDRASAYADHLERMRSLESKERSFLASGSWGESMFHGGLERRIANATAWREEAEKWAATGVVLP